MSKFQIEERIVQLLQHFGLDQVHVAARLDTDWIDLAVDHAELIRSLTLIYPWGTQIEALQPLASRLLVIDGDYAADDPRTQIMAQLPGVVRATIPGYTATFIEDMMADRRDAIGTAMLDFLARMEAVPTSTQRVTLPQGRGEFAGITYQILGSGPPLLLLPLVFAPSQWDPILPMLSAHFCTITLSGANVGIVSMLEARGHSDYLRVVRHVLEEVPFRSGGKVLEVGCGTAVVSRWLVQHTAKANPIIAIDLNPYLLREAEALATKEGFHEIIEFREGNAHQLPFADNSFHVTIACTILEEGDANQMVSEMVRVTEAGGYIAIVVQAGDMPWLVNLRLSRALKAKVEAPRGGIAAGTCADSSLYQRMLDAGLFRLNMRPQLAVLTTLFVYYYLNRIEGSLNVEERQEWQAALTQAETAGTLFIAQPYHSALGIKPRPARIC